MDKVYIDRNEHWANTHVCSPVKNDWTCRDRHAAGVLNLWRFACDRCAAEGKDGVLPAAAEGGGDVGRYPGGGVCGGQGGRQEDARDEPFRCAGQKYICSLVLSSEGSVCVMDSARFEYKQVHDCSACQVGALDEPQGRAQSADACKATRLLGGKLFIG